MRSIAARNPDGGHTLVEAAVVLVISSFLVGIIANLVITAGDSQNYTRRMARATELSQELVNEMRDDMLSAVSMHENDAAGTTLLAAFQFDPRSLPLATTRLPRAVVTGPFGREATSGVRTGNALAFAAQAWTTEFEAGSGTRYLIDVYRFYCYYLAKNGAGPRPGDPGGLTLAKFVSEPVTDGDQIDAITDLADRTQVLKHLMRQLPGVNGKLYPPSRLLWKRGQPISEADAMREIDPSDFTLSTTPVAPRPSGNWTIQADRPLSEIDLLEFRGFSVASNYADSRIQTGRFGVTNHSGDGFPHGLEIQFGGPPSGRQVLLRLIIVGTNRKGTRAHAEVRTTVMIEDL